LQVALPSESDPWGRCSLGDATWRRKAGSRGFSAFAARHWTLANYCSNNNSMRIEFDAAKRDQTLRERGLDMARADEAFAGATLTVSDDRREYGEDRFITI
jgi:hypothetical protein